VFCPGYLQDKKGILQQQGDKFAVHEECAKFPRCGADVLIRQIAQQSADVGILFHVDKVGNDVIVRSMVNTSVVQFLHTLIPNFLPLADSWWQR
jgi:hypothetical protein